uniref:Integrin beta n=1 Tax=Periophthalmus magnuspinnatus TaxID=409849 RepID=A0A3B4B3G6_9GOBI
MIVHILMADLFFLLFFLSPGESVCRSSNLTSCTECLKRGPQCAWCFKENFLEGAASNYRCDLAENLLLKGCESEFLEQTETKVEVDTTISSTQVSPQDISVHLGPGFGSVCIFTRYMMFKTRYPVDLYSLVDVSASMQENLDHVSLSLRMTQHSSDLWLGFGSFVDKPVSPYISVHPSKINNPCSDYEVRCRPAHGFHHVLSMTGNMSEFTRVIKRQRISGNMDTPEGGLDAMLQAVKAVGWRPEAKRLLLFMTDQPSHLALDSRLAGIVIPNDGLCHLEDNIYTASTVMDHPSLGQLSDKLLENHIYSIFAVEKHALQLLPHFIPPLESGIDVSESTGEVKVFFFFFFKNYFPLQVYFNITVGMRSCPDNGEDEDISVTVRPVGYNESSVIRIHSKCGCRCESAGLCHNRGQACEETGQEQRDSSLNQSCQSAGSDLMCSGRGVCECGRCVCDQNRLGTIYGKYCEKDDFSCPYFRGLMCGGHGDCVLGECVCKNEWTGESCECPASSTSCQSADGLLCSGHGECVCGRCVCSDSRRSGSFCERCPACQSTCQLFYSVVFPGLTFSISPSLLPGQIGDKWVQCMYVSNNNCRYPFQITTEVGQAELHINTRAGINTLEHFIQVTSAATTVSPVHPGDFDSAACCQCYSCVLHFLSDPSSLYCSHTKLQSHHVSG